MEAGRLATIDRGNAPGREGVGWALILGLIDSLALGPGQLGILVCCLWESVCC